MNVRMAERSAATMQDDSSAWVCAVMAIVCFTIGIIVPAVLLGVLKENKVEFAGLTFAVAQVLAVFFGLIGARNPLGRYTFRTALGALAATGIALAIWFFMSYPPAAPAKLPPARIRADGPESHLPSMPEADPPTK